MKRTLYTLLLLLLTTSAIADVNFTEKTLFTSDWDTKTTSAAYSMYFGFEDENGISISTYNSSITNATNKTIDGIQYDRVWFYQSLTSGVTNYNRNFFQVSSTNHAIQQLKLCVRNNSTQFVAVGWQSTIDDTAEYYQVFNYDSSDEEFRWVTLDVSSWANVRNIRLYYGFGNSNLTVDNEKVKVSIAGDASQPYIYGIQVGIDEKNISTTISSYGVAAFSSGNALDFTNVTECSAFYADSYANSVLHLTKATGVVPPHFGLLLSSADEGAVSFSIPIATAEQAAACTLTNKFVATDQAAFSPTTSTEALALGVKNGTAGFYYVGAGVTVPQYRFYLPAPAVGDAKSVSLDFGNTAINSIPFETPATQDSVGESAIPSQTTQPTDLLGRPCPTPRAGALYIKGGKAYLTPTR